MQEKDDSDNIGAMAVIDENLPLDNVNKTDIVENDEINNEDDEINNEDDDVTGPSFIIQRDPFQRSTSMWYGDTSQTDLLDFETKLELRNIAKQFLEEIHKTLYKRFSKLERETFKQYLNETPASTIKRFYPHIF